MKIIKFDRPSTLFESLRNGQVFLDEENTVFMKVSPDAPDILNAVNLETGDCAYFSASDSVAPVEATLTLE